MSCHVERVLDDRTFARYERFVARRPYGFAVASLVRPPDPAFGEDAEVWAEHVRRLVPHGPLGHHTHFGGPTQARPVGGDPAARVRDEAAVFRKAALAPTWFCGGGWYMDEDVAAAAAGLGYADCTGTSFVPAYLPSGAPRLHAEAATWLRVDGSRVLEVPTTHSIGRAVRGALERPGAPFVHVYFHDFDLLRPTRRLALEAALAVLSRRRRPTDLDSVAAEVASIAPELGIAVVRA